MTEDQIKTIAAALEEIVAVVERVRAGKPE